MNTDFKDYFTGIKSELTDEATRKSSKKYYSNAMKDLTQVQRINFLQILKGNLNPHSQEAAEIVTSLQKYKTAYDASQDKEAYITVRNPPREKSWFKSIARALSNWGGRVSSEKVLKALIKTDIEKVEDPVMGEWLSKFQDNYLAHATGTNTKKILEGEVLKPAEMILREGIDVEYEAGGHIGQRGTAKLPKLDAADIQSLKKVLFSAADKARLEEIRNDPIFPTAKEKYKELSRLRKELNNVDDDDSKTISKMMKEINKRSSDPDVALYLEYAALNRKQYGLRALFALKNKRTGDRSPNIDTGTRMAAWNVLDQLGIKYNCKKKEILVAFDESQPRENRIDSYLRKKFTDNKYTQNTLAVIRSDVLATQKLNQEIRMSENEILWAYGNSVILLGGDKSHVREKFGNEAVLDTPIVGEDFYTIPLKTTDNLLILGPKVQLEPFKAEYGDKIVYIEDLSNAQKDALNVPEELR